MPMIPSELASQLWRVSPAAMARYLSAPRPGQPEPYRFEVPRHVRLVSDVICDAVAGRSRFVIITLPPRHGKSEVVSKWTPLWFLENWPQKHVMICGYGNDFAKTWGRAVRNKAVAHQEFLSLRLADDSKAADCWNTPQGGGMLAAGIGGSITGRGADLLIVDDPVKNHQEASSIVYRDAVWDWWTSTARTRLHPGGAIIVCMTRWHSDDLVGRLLAQSGKDLAGDQWRVVNLPAEAEADDPLGRALGAPLWPERYDTAALAQLKASVGAETWAALYQQHPYDLAKEGNVYNAFGPANVESCSFDSRLPICWSLDFNVDPMCSVIAQIHEEHTAFTFLTNELRRELRILREICLPNSSTLEACEEFVNITQDWLVKCRLQGRPLRVKIYGDRSGNSRHTNASAGANTDYKLIQDFFKHRPGYIVTYHVKKANPAVRDRVNAFNSILCNAAKQRRCFIDPGCESLIRDFKQVSWKRDSNGNTSGQIDKSNPFLTHVSDAAGYLVEAEFGYKAKAGPQSGVLQ